MFIVQLSQAFLWKATLYNAHQWILKHPVEIIIKTSIIYYEINIMEYLNLSALGGGYIFVFMIFTLRSSAEKLKTLFDLCGFGAEELALYHLAQANVFRRDFQSRLVSYLPYGVTGL